MSQKFVIFALAILFAVCFAKDEIKDSETKRIIKNNDTIVSAPVGSNNAQRNQAAGVGDSPTKTRVAAIGGGTGAAYRCYQCNSASIGEEECDSSDTDVLEKFIKPCSGLPKGSSLEGITNAVQCRKIEQNIEGEANRIIRECAYTGEEELDGKKRTGNKGIITYFYTCFNEEGAAQAEPCNPATQAFVSIVAILLVAVTQIFQRL